MKKLLCFIITIALLFTSTSPAFAKNHHDEDKRHDHDVTKYYQNKRIKAQKYDFKYDKSKLIKFGRYKLPTTPISQGMDAKITYDNGKYVLTVVKGSITIVIDFKKEIVTVNGVVDSDTGIFSGKNDNRMTVLIQYIADLLGVWTYFDKDKVTVEVPGLDYPTNVTVNPVGNLVLGNTLNSTNLYLNASAKIKAGQATGGRAELYVGSKLVATDSTIVAEDTYVTFTTADNAPSNAKLQAAVPKGGVVTVKLFNSKNQSVMSKTGNPNLLVDYVLPTINDVTAATFDAVNGKVYLSVNGAGAAGDKVNVTKLSFYDSALARAYQLTEAAGTGSTGTVKNDNSIEIILGSADRAGLAGFGSSTLLLNIAPGALIKDAAGNISSGINQAKTVTVTASNVVTGLNAPTNVSVSPVGGNVKANTLNTTNLYMTATANITAGQATGGKAELYVDTKLVSIDANITATDTTVTFSTSDNNPTNAKLQAAIPKGGPVYVKLYNANGQSIASSVANPTLIVDYVAPTISSIDSAIYNKQVNQLYITVNGAGATGDKVNVTKLYLYDASLGRSYQLTNTSGSGSSGVVSSSTTLIINLGSNDRLAMKDFGTTTVTLNLMSGSVLYDEAGNPSPVISVQSIPVTVIK